MPPTALQTIPITWPFAVWGLDMVRPLKGGSHKKKYLLVMVDEFTKWIEAKPVKTAKSGPVIDFISGVVHCYGIPHSIITNNGSNFTVDKMKTCCGKALSSTTPPSTSPKQTDRSNVQRVSS